jgi:hypothetical protein
MEEVKAEIQATVQQGIQRYEKNSAYNHITKTSHSVSRFTLLPLS